MQESAADRPGEGTGPSAWQMMTPVIDLVTPMAVRTAATLRIADLLADGPVALADLARRSGSDRDALGRLLDHLVCQGVFATSPTGEYELNDIAALLRSDHPSGMQVSLDLNGFGGQMDLAFTGLLHTVRTGQPAWESVFGAPFWAYLAADPAMSASFDAVMAAGPEYLADAVRGYDWSDARHIVDVGGGAGRLVAAVLDAYPTARATLVDLPATVDRGRDYLRTRGLADRCEFVGQSFFDELPAGGDVYVLSNVLHDWSDKDATAILRRCAEATGDRGRVVLIEDGDQAMVAEMNLRMLVLCGGRQRGTEEYGALAAAAGLRVTSTHPTPLGQVVVEYSRRTR